MKDIAKTARSVNDSVTLALTSKGKELKAKGVDVISFGAGEPDFPTPEYIRNAAKKALDEGFTRYTASSGIVELRRAIAEKFRRDNRIDYTPDQILVTVGGKQAIFTAIQCLCDPDSEVIFPAPYWVSYPEMAKAVGARPVMVKTDAAHHYKMTPEQLEAAVTPRSRLLLLNSPNNPTGTVYTGEEIRAIGEVAVKNDLWIVSDEIYEKLIYGRKHVSIASLSEELKRRTIVVNGFSKAYAMTGWRVGYAAGPKDVIEAMGRMQSHMISNVNSISQKACLTALEGDSEQIEPMRREYERRRDYMTSRLDAIPGISYPEPRGAFYVLVDVSQYYGRTAGETIVRDSMTFCEACLDMARLLLIPGRPFGADWGVRFSFAASMKDLERGLDRFAEFIGSLKE